MVYLYMESSLTIKRKGVLMNATAWKNTDEHAQ